jgi:hypothetical protein
MLSYIFFFVSIPFYLQAVQIDSANWNLYNVRNFQPLAGLRWRGPAATENYRPVLSSERALQNNKPRLFKRKSQGEIKTGRGSQTGA